jgi:hypothetical protein
MPREWITKLAEDERKRDEVRARATDAAARKADLVAVHGQRLFDELRGAVTRDVEAFRAEFPHGDSRAILFEDAQPDGAFVVRKPGFPTAALTVEPRLSAAAVSCRYRFTPTNSMPPREDRIEFVFSSNANDDVLVLKHHGTGETFTGPDALSEYLLVPVFTGRPR